MATAHSLVPDKSRAEGREEEKEDGGALFPGKNDEGRKMFWSFNLGYAHTLTVSKPAQSLCK